MRVFGSLQTKLFALVFAATLVIVAGVTFRVVVAARAAGRLALERKTASYARLLGRELEPALAFDDRQTARETFEAIALDADVRAMALFDARGALVFSDGTFAEPPPDAAAVARAAGVVRVAAPVVAREGARGSVTVELSTASVERETTSAVREAALLGALAVAAGALASWLIARSVGRRVRGIAAATRAVAAGDFGQPGLEDGVDDELGELSKNFGVMVAEIRALLARLQKQAEDEQSRLAALVQQRTVDLDRKQQALQLVLDTVGDGFVLLDADGRVTEARAAVVETWFGPIVGAPTLGELVGAVDPTFAAWFGIGFDEIMHGELPLEVSIDQMPREIAHGDRRYAVRYRPVMAGERAELLVASIYDVTADLERARLDAEQRETRGMFQRAIADRAGVFDFLDEGAALVAVLGNEPPAPRAALLRAAHTVKGTSALFGLESVAAACHAYESSLMEDDASATSRARDEVARTWKSAEGRLREMLGARDGRIELLPGEIEELGDAVRVGMPPATILALVERLRLEPAARCLERFVEPARSLAVRLGKPAPNVRVLGDSKLDARRLKGVFAALSHLVRNAVDHGIEPPEERARAGKSPEGNLTLTALEGRGELILIVTDDGGGIAWDRVAARARASGLLATRPEDLEEALFADGLSTKEDVSDVSGRGVGLGALREAVALLGGAIRVRSELGASTTFRIRIPEAAPAPPN